MNRIRLLQLLVALTLVATVLPVFAAKGEIFATRKGAINGYDTVAYFTDGRPTKGKNEFSYEWKGETWKFSNPEHLAMFKADPEKYAPQYGGYCAYGLSKDSLVRIDPSSWTIHEGKLYLNYSRSVQRSWNENREGFIISADRYYTKRFDSEETVGQN